MITKEQPEAENPKLPNYDEKYIELMDTYKKVRKNPKKVREADKLFEALDKLRKSGKVSSNAMEVARYL